MPLMGKVSDVIGRKLSFCICMLLFTLGSMLSAIAPNIELLIVFRFIQGIGIGGSLPVAISIIADTFPEAKQKYIGFVSSVFPIGQIIGPNLGAWLTHEFGWQSNFWIFIPLGVVIVALSIAFLPGTSKIRKGNLDLIGVLLLTSIITVLMLGISFMGSEQGEISWLMVGISFALVIVLTIIFLKHQNKVSDPIIDLAVLQKRPFIAANVYNFIFGAGLFGCFSFIPLYAVSVYNMSLFESGLILTPRSIATMIAAFITSLFLVRWGYRRPMLFGTTLFAICLVLLSLEIKELNMFNWQISNFVLVSGILFFTGVSQGTATPACNNACIELMPNRVGTITGIRGMFRQVGGTISIGITALVLEKSLDISRGFQIVFIGLGTLLFLSIPIIFLIPEKAKAPLNEEHSYQL
jgi:MFS family permease